MRGRAERPILLLGILALLGGVLCHPSVLGRVLGRGHGFLPDTRLLLSLLSGLQIAAGFMFLAARRRPALLANFLLLFVSLALVLGGTEFLLRRVAPQIPESRQLFEKDGRWGWQFVPGASDVVVFPRDYTGLVTINADGFRDREYPRSPVPGTPRVLVLGDSFTAGIDVDAEDVYTEVMEHSRLSGVEVLNFGVNGFGPTQEMLLLEGRGFEYRPDIVVMAIYVRNDFDDLSGELDWGRGYRRPRAVLDDSTGIRLIELPEVPESGPAPEPRWRVPSLSRSHLVTLVQKRLANRNDEDQIPPEVRLCRKEPRDRTLAETLPILRAVLARTAARCADHGARFAVLVAPSVVQVYPDPFWTRIVREYGLEPAEYDLTLPNRLVADLCAEQGIPCLDLLDPLREGSDPDHSAYHRRDIHWNASGHQLVAGALSRYLVSLGWIDARHLVTRGS